MSAVQKSYRKNILREMKGNASRMVSLFGIVALGVMMLTGLMSIAPSMRSAAQKYYVQQNVFDLRVLSTLGLSDQDIAAIAATPGVEAVMPVCGSGEANAISVGYFLNIPQYYHLTPF